MTRCIAPSDWDRTATHRLWDWIGSRQQMHGTYFTHSAGRGIVGFLDCAKLLRGPALDYGCGPGFLTDLLTAAGLETFAADYSPKSIAQIEARMGGKPNWQGARLIDNLTVPFPADTFQLITCIETIEHVPDEGLAPLIGELHRVLRPGGTLLLTTPNNENLDANLNYCPFCDTEFHRWQHLRSWGAREVGELVRANGLTPLLVHSMDFTNFQSSVRLPAWQELSFGILRGRINFAIMRALDQFRPHPFPSGREFAFRLGHGSGPNLCVVATKTDRTPI